MMFLGVLRLLFLLLALLLLRLLVLLLASIVGPTGPGQAGVAGPKPRRGEVGTPQQVSESTPATFDLTVLIVIPAGRDTLVNAMVRGCTQRAAGPGRTRAPADSAARFWGVEPEGAANLKKLDSFDCHLESPAKMTKSVTKHSASFSCIANGKLSSAGPGSFTCV